jgi:hypothetical protein
VPAAPAAPALAPAAFSSASTDTWQVSPAPGPPVGDADGLA